MKIKRITVFGLLASFVISSAFANQERWYSDKQVAEGKSLFAENCAVCHGADAASTKEWRKRDAQGNYPPPPLNGTAHTWHHSKKLLVRTIQEGGKRFGGKMPPFEGRLTAQEMDAIIAWFQSLWPDKIYQAWLERGGIPEAKRKQLAKKNSTVSEKQAEAAQQPTGLMVGESRPSPVKDIQQSRFGSRVIYVTKDGRYGFFGDLIDMQTGENLTEKVRREDRLNQLKTYGQGNMVVYPARGKQKSSISIFTDTTCPFCRKLHVQVPELNQRGVSVSYIPFPRSGQQGQGYSELRSIWCSKDRNVAMDVAKGVKKGELGSGDCNAAQAVDKGFQLGVALGIRGTPAIILPDGELVSGYRPTSTLLKLLDIE